MLIDRSDSRLTRRYGRPCFLLVVAAFVLALVFQSTPLLAGAVIVVVGYFIAAIYENRDNPVPGLTGDEIEADRRWLPLLIIGVVTFGGILVSILLR